MRQGQFFVLFLVVVVVVVVFVVVVFVFVLGGGLFFCFFFRSGVTTTSFNCKGTDPNISDSFTILPMKVIQVRFQKSGRDWIKNTAFGDRIVYQFANQLL